MAPPGSILDDLIHGEEFALLFAGQGGSWWSELDDLISGFGVRDTAEALLRGVVQRLQPLHRELAPSGGLAVVMELLEQDRPIVQGQDRTSPARALPAVALQHLLALHVLESLGLDLDAHPPRVCVGHSQGLVAAAVVDGLPAEDALLIAVLAGAATTQVAARTELEGRGLLAVGGVGRDALAAALADFSERYPSHRVETGLRNAPRNAVLSGPAEHLDLFEAFAEQRRADTLARRGRGESGVPGFVPTLDRLAVGAAYHHRDLTPMAQLVESWAEAVGLDPVLAADLARKAVVSPVDWPQTLAALEGGGLRRVLDLGPASLGTQVSAGALEGRGLQLIAPFADQSGWAELTAPGATPRTPRCWSDYAPRVVRLPDGSLRTETAFTRLTGKSPVLLPGMTPTTADPEIVAAAANHGFWAELAGGGQVTEEVFDVHLERLAALLEPGATWQFNALLLDPYLWGLQLGQRKLLQRARHAGASVDGVVVTAGVPELDAAVALVEELREVGISHVAFKPGTTEQIRQVLAIADAVAPFPLIIQIEGGQAGGHHSWEDLDELLLRSYASIRRRTQVVLCVGGGIGAPADAVRYLTGAWATEHGCAAMPVDGVLVGTAVMAAAEAKTSASVKELLVRTPGVRRGEWVGRATSAGGMTSGRSQLGADLYEIDNASARCGRLLDEVAGDGAAVARRRDEIIQALAATAKPYFGDLGEMTYAALLDRFVDLTSAADPTNRERFHRLLQRAEARLHRADHGAIPTLFPQAPAQLGEAVTVLIDTFPDAADSVVHPADVDFFVEVCRLPGKPVPFVPVLDADVRRWWRSDSLWQSHDSRFEADAVCVIPGPVSVAGITKADEPVASILSRFEAAVTEALLVQGGAPLAVAGRRRVQGDGDPFLAQLLSAPDVLWAGRLQPNPLRALGEGWQITETKLAEHPASGASVRVIDVPAARPRAELWMPVAGHQWSLSLTASPAPSGVPVVETEAAVEAMRALTLQAAGGSLAPVKDGVATWQGTLTEELIAAHTAATSVPGGSLVDGVVPDAWVGLAWPAIFAVIAEQRDVDGVPVVEGLLRLVHLDHQVASHAGFSLGQLASTVQIAAEVTAVHETTQGRVLAVQVEFDADGWNLRLTERFLVLGRAGRGELLPAPAYAAVDPGNSTPRVPRLRLEFDAPRELSAFAHASGDFNPIHLDPQAAGLAGLPGPIVHGMWLSASAQQALSRATGRRVLAWTASFVGMVRPGDSILLTGHQVGVQDGAERIELTAAVEGVPVLMASAVLEAPRTMYAFPGQGIQAQGMGMAGYARCAAAREVWDSADRHTRSALGFSILDVVRRNPRELTVQPPGDRPAVLHRHPDGVLNLTQFTQVAMAVLGSAQVAELKAAGVFVPDAYLAGHSVGEYNALAAISGVLSLEAVVEVVFQRGSVMHTLVPRDGEGRSNYRLAAIRPAQAGLDDAEVVDFVADLAQRSGEFLQVANLNLRGAQYAVAGTVAGCAVLEEELEQRRRRHGGKAAFVLIPGIDVPFHSAVLRDGVPDFRDTLARLLPEQIEPGALVGRYIPNLVPRLFSLERDFVAEVADTVPSPILDAVLDDFPAWAAQPERLARTLLIELLAWQFASPVRWIETQDLALSHPLAGGLGLDAFVEVGVGTAPTVANLASSTLRIEGFAAGHVEVFNAERDRRAVFAEDEAEPETEPESGGASDTAEPTAEPAADISVGVSPPASVTPGATSGATRGSGPAPVVADLTVDVATAARTLLALWARVRPDQLMDADTIESLCEGASSRRNQALMDLGAEFSVGAIDGAAEAGLVDLCASLGKLAPRYRPYGAVLTPALADLTKKALGPLGVKPAAIGEFLTQRWGLGPGWAQTVMLDVALAAREGVSLRGGDLGEVLKNEEALWEFVEHRARLHAEQNGATLQDRAAATSSLDQAAAADLLKGLTGPDGVLAKGARDLLARLGVDGAPAASEALDPADQATLDQVQRELGDAWLSATRAAFDPARAVVLDDSWAIARDQLARVALAAVDAVPNAERYAGFGADLARQARWWSQSPLVDAERAQWCEAVAQAAESPWAGEFAHERAVVTGASPGGIAAAVLARLLQGGAHVVATTSSLTPSRLSFFKDLYARHASAEAVLWLVPANLASNSDVDQLVEWVTSAQVERFGPLVEEVKPAWEPTLLFPFAAGSVRGELCDVGPRAEIEARILLWSVERLVAGLVADRGSAQRLHVVLPGSPNRGLFGGDGAYGEVKAALDAVVAKWSVEPTWARHVSLAHAIIGWTRGTGLMGALDDVASAADAQGIQTFSTDLMAEHLLALCTPERRAAAASEPLVADLSGGLWGSTVDLAALREGTSVSAVPGTVEPSMDAEQKEPEPEESEQLAALPPSPSRPQPWEEWWSDAARHASQSPVPRVGIEDLVVVVGAAELGPWGTSRTRYEAEVGELSPAGVLELAWSLGLVRYEQGAWVDSDTEEVVAEAELYQTYLERVSVRCGIREFHDDGNLSGHSAPLLVSVYLDDDVSFDVETHAEALAFAQAAPADTAIQATSSGWRVTRRAGSQLRVPRRMTLSRTVGGQVPEGFDPARYGIPADMLSGLDRVAVWNLVCTVDAFLSSGFSPAELMRWVHPALVANTQGTGMGGMNSMQSLYLDTLLGETKPNDLLQEALPNVTAAHVVQSYVGSYGAMVHPVAACATTAVSIEEGVDKIRLGKAEFVVAGGYDDLGVEGMVGFAEMSATAESAALAGRGIEVQRFSRANDRRRGGFVESQGGGTVLLARGDVAVAAGLPVLAVVAYAASFADGVHTSIPAPGVGALAAGLGGTSSPLARGLADLGLTADDIGVISKHDTSTKANDPNESDLHERLAAALGRTPGNPLFVVSQKTLTGHAKGGAAAFQTAGLCQVLASGQVPGNRSLDCLDPVLREHPNLVWPRETLRHAHLRAGLITSLGFGHVSALVALAHPSSFVAALAPQAREEYVNAVRERLSRARAHRLEVLLGKANAYQRPKDRRFAGDAAEVKAAETAMLLDPTARLRGHRYVQSN